MGFLTGDRGHTSSSSDSTSTSTYGNSAFSPLLGTLSPLLGNSANASNMMSSLLGLGGTPAPSNPVTGTLPTMPAGSTPTGDTPAAGSNNLNGIVYGSDPSLYDRTSGTYHVPESGGGSGPAIVTGATTVDPTSGTSPFGPGAGSYTTGPASSANSAMQNFANSTGMQFVLGQGTNAIDQGFAGKGMLNSGATAKALEQYGQGVGQTYLNQYMQNMNSLMSQGNEAGRDLAIAGTGGSSTSNSSANGTGSTPKPGLLEALGGGQGIGASVAAIAPLL